MAEYCGDYIKDLHNLQPLSPLLHAFHPVPELHQRQSHLSHNSAHSKFLGLTSNAYDDAAVVAGAASAAVAV